MSDRIEALRAEVERRFVTTSDVLALAGAPLTLVRPASADALISEEDYVLDERLPYWADLWPSACVLAEVLAAERSDARTLLELGCGLGFVAIAALRAGFHVTATDYYQDALLFTRLNALAATGREPATRMVNWRELPPDLGTFAVVCAADVLYERPYSALVAGVLDRALAPDGVALVTDPGRVGAEAFLAECAARGLRCETEVHPWREGKVRQRISLYRIRRAT